MVNFALQNEQFKDRAQQMDIGGDFSASSVDCEGGFSLMNALKTKIRSLLKDYLHVDVLMRIKSCHLEGGLIDLDKVYSEWMTKIQEINCKC